MSVMKPTTTLYLFCNQKLSHIRRFFVSLRNFDYALSQENHRLQAIFCSRTPDKGSRWFLPKKTDGFSIVELLITLVIIGTAFGAFMVTYTTIQNINKKAIDVNKANSLAFAKVQEYENKSFSSLPNTTPLNTLQEVEDFSSSLPNSLESPRSGKVYISTISGNLKQVVVTIQFGGGASARLIQYGNFIQRNGIGQ